MPPASTPSFAHCCSSITFLITAAFIHSFIAAAFINQCLHSFPASILSFAHCCSTDSLITAAFIRSLLQHRFFHCCSIHLLNGALLVTPAEFISMPPASIPAFAHCCSSDCGIAVVSFFSLLQYLFCLCYNINFLIAATPIFSLLQY